MAAEALREAALGGKFRPKAERDIYDASESACREATYAR
jgi:hypothetical protein